MKTREYIDDITEHGWSDCCSAEVINGLCSQCREHCDIIGEDYDDDDDSWSGGFADNH